jgi:DNA-binding FadR family transcriptional regulator
MRTSPLSSGSRSATERTISEHTAILAALRARDPQLAEAAALVHVSTTEAWFRSVLQTEDDGSDTDGNLELRS